MSKTKESPYADVLNAVAGKKKLKAEEVGRLDAAIRRVGWVESKNDPTALQAGGGPGRGEFQFELTEGGSGANATARQRLKNFEKKYGPVRLSKADRETLAQDDPDFSQLSQDAQRAIVLADWVMKTPADEVGDLARGKYPIGDFYLDYHWAGDPNERPQKQQQFLGEMRDYERRYGRAN